MLQVKFTQGEKRKTTYNAIGHKVVPVQLSATVILLVKVFNFRNEVLQLSGE